MEFSLRLSLRTALLACLLAVSLSAQTLYRFSEPQRRHSYELSTTERSAGAPVFYDRDELPSAEALKNMTPDRRARALANATRILTAKLLVRIQQESDWAPVNSTAPLSRETSDLAGWWLVSYESPDAALRATNRLLVVKNGPSFMPVFARLMQKKQAASGTLQRAVNDPLYERQWHLANDNFGIRPGAAWDIVTGKGINIVVVDDGLEVAHEDLAANAYPLQGNFHRNYNEGPANDPTPLQAEDNHGTNCAGLIGARGFNNVGVIGVAPEARLMGVRLIAGPASDDDTAGALGWQPNGLTTHISSNSWGPADDGTAQGRMGPLQAAAIEKMATTGRDGLGTIFVVSAGNGFGSGDDSSYDAFSRSRFVIGVGAVNRTGGSSSYSENGMNVAISALGGEFDPPGVTWTTNNSGPAALEELMKKFERSQAPMNYSDAFNGTSAAAPQVSGAAALLLERNPRLGYRDVKEILMKTARREGLNNGDEFANNGAGFSFSHSFGAGLLNVAAAVDAAATWKNLGTLQSTKLNNEIIDLIPDGGTDGLVSSFDFSKAPRLRVEHVELTVNIAHDQRGDLAFVIQSPSGMLSVAAPRAADEGKDLENYIFTSVRHWGENSSGTWKVKVLDSKKNGKIGAVGDLTVTIYGTVVE